MIHGAMNGKLYDILKGTNAPEIDADAARDNVLAEFRRIGGEIE
jgi:hypothetical protein